jgi:hypothetical protein
MTWGAADALPSRRTVAMIHDCKCDACGEDFTSYEARAMCLGCLEEIEESASPYYPEPTDEEIVEIDAAFAESPF